jgi:hypothetical protein
MGREYAAFSAGQGGGGKGLDKWALQLCRGAVRVGDGDGRVGTALRCVLALLVLMGSLAKGVVMEIEHEHHGNSHEHGVHEHGHDHRGHDGDQRPSDDQDGGKGTQPVPETHTHVLLFEMGPMTAHSAARIGHVPMGKPGACVSWGEDCPDGPTFELLKPPQ